jgi:small subunit ribosomal protein S20
LPAKKAGRRSLKRYRRNGSVRTATRTAISKALRSVESGDATAAEPIVRDAISVLDRAVRKGVLHKNNVARRKSRISAKLNRIRGAEPA